MPHYMYIKIATALNSKQKAVKGSKILFLGVAYKPNIDDARESPALEIIDITMHKGGLVTYHDPFITEVKTPSGNSLHSISELVEGMQNADCVVITTNHQVFNPEMIKKHARLIVDLKNVINEVGENIYTL